jgi:DNA-binding CsgD family transcriptional regulator
MAKDNGMLKGIIAMGLFINWVNLLPFYGPQLAMLGITGNYLPHIFTTLHVFGLIYGSIKSHGEHEDSLFYKLRSLSPYILSGLTFGVLIPLTSDFSLILTVVFAAMGFLSGLSVSRWLAWFSSEATRNRRILIFGKALALTYILMSITTIATNLLFNSSILGLVFSSASVFAGGLLINELDTPSAKKISFNFKAIIPPPGLILFALFAYASISLLYDQVFNWGRQIAILPYLLIIPYVFVGFFLTRWVSSKNRIYFAVVALFLVGFGFLSYLLDPAGDLPVVLTSVLINSGLLCIHLYYWVSLVECQDPDYAPITISVGVSFELVVFAAIYSVTPYLNLDLDRSGLLTGVAGLVFVLLGLVLLALDTHQVNVKPGSRSADGDASGRISTLKDSNPRVSTMSAVLSFHEVNPKVMEDLLKDKFYLTDREVDVAYLLFLGYKNNEIKKKLSITVNTLKYHIRNIYSKLEVNSRDEAIDVFYAVLIKSDRARITKNSIL